MIAERAEVTINMRRTGWAVGKTGGDGGGGDGTGAASTSGTSRRKAPFRILPRSSAFPLSRMCGGKSNISDRVAVKRASRVRFRSKDVSKTATRLEMHEKPPLVLRHCPGNARKTALQWRTTALKTVPEGRRCAKTRHLLDSREMDAPRGERAPRQTCRKIDEPRDGRAARPFPPGPASGLSAPCALVRTCESSGESLRPQGS